MNKLVIGTLLFFLMISSNGASSKIRIGDQVMYGNSRKVVDFVGKGGKIVLSNVSGEGRQVVTNVKDVQRLMRCLTDNLCSGHKILYGRYICEMLFAYGDNHLVCETEDYGSERTFELKDVTRLYTEKGGYKEGDKVYEISYSNIVTVEYIYFEQASAMETKKWIVVTDDGGSRRFVSADDLFKVRDCYGDYCSNDKVIYGDSIRTIDLASSDGRLLLRGDDRYYKTVVEADEVFMYEKCEGWCSFLGGYDDDGGNYGDDGDGESTVLDF